MSAPVMKLASGDDRNATPRAIPSSTPNRPSGMRWGINALNWSNSAGGSPSFANAALLIGPGLTELTRMFRVAS